MNKQHYFSLLIFPLSTFILSACGGGSSTTPKDTTQAVIVLNGANPLTIPLNKPFNDPSATATDNTDGDISNKVTQTNNINTDVAACYTQEYKVTDAAGNISSKVRIVLVGNDQERHSPNHPPFAIEDSQSTTYKNTVTLNVLKNDIDIDCDELSISSITQPTRGTAVINPDKTITFNPQETVGSFFFTYTISDAHGGTASTGVSIGSHDPDDGNDSWPDAIADSVTTKKGTEVFIDVLANDSDLDGDDLIIEMVDTPRHGTIEINSNGLIYTPESNFTGKESFHYGIHDRHGHINSAIVTVAVTP